MCSSRDHKTHCHGSGEAVQPARAVDADASCQALLVCFLLHIYWYLRQSEIV